jgi:general secretion pathway protein F/type IV pilus assembly protein PilC
LALLIFVVPNFEAMFATLRARGELPMMTDWLLNFSGFLKSAYALIPLVIIGAGVYWLRNFLQTEEGKTLWDKWVLKLPGIGGILLNLAVSRFCRVLGTLLHNGVPIIRSLEISADAAGNRVLGSAINKASENITAGHSLSKPLLASGHFPANVTEMISVAEESNSLDTVLVDIADGMDKRIWRQLDLFVKLLEPVMLLFIAGFVLFVVIALLYPAMKSGSAI